ncbi:MerC family mercury resistance protein [Qipengyuania sp. DGS5-3]|uniref:MerC family mercury resistance protein n=1 Tax=Qipengyuania sp. DGS5-3 TaxID=3349632 RepID=UPI0036D3B816
MVYLLALVKSSGCVSGIDMSPSADRMGMTLSVLCVLHCVALPPVLAVLLRFEI